MKIYSTAVMRRVDQTAINDLGIPSTLLMENAARGVYEAISTEFPAGLNISAAVFCGAGNNGGDGIALARLLLTHGAAVRCFLTASRDKMSADAREMERRLNEYGGICEDWNSDYQEYVERADLIVDAIFGTGLNREVDNAAGAVIELINKSHAYIVSIDIASGVEGDTGRILGAAAQSDMTVTITAPKAGHYLSPGGQKCGKLIVIDIGIPGALVDAEEHVAQIITGDMVDRIIPQRRDDSHKGDFGKLLLLCSSEGLTGAGTIAARAALRSGAGLVSMGVPRAVYNICASSNVEAMIFPLDCDNEGRISLAALPIILEKLKSCDAFMFGPGLGRSDDLNKLAAALVCESKVPLVIDADGINALSSNIDILHKAVCPIVLTPHPGEFARIYNAGEMDRIQSARSFSQTYGVTLVLKGHRTVVAAGGEVYINTTGNAGMATGGSGDMLAGMIVSLIGQGIPPDKAAVAAVRLHGAAGDICAREIGVYGMLPSDMIEALPQLLP